MNANELADGILAIEERIFLTKKEHQLFQNSATMLRQQQAEIEALKQIIDANNLNQNIGQFVKPTNKPVAIVNTNCENNIQWNVLKPQEYNGYFLYTHPKELTDEEIWEIVSLKWWDWEDSFDVTGFARAILKNAQNK